MKRKLFIAFMIAFSILLSINLFISLICGAPVGSNDLIRYIIGAVGMSVLLPSGFTFFFLATLRLSEKLKESEEAAVVEKEQENEDAVNTLSDVQIPILVSAITEKRNLSSEEKERIISFIEDL